MITSYNEMPIGIYQRLLDIDRQQLSPEETQLKRIALLTDIAEEELLTMPIAEFKLYSSRTLFLTEPLPEPRKIIPYAYKIGKYDLMLHSNLESITTAQYIDFQAYCKEADSHIVEILSVFLVPKGCRYLEGYNVNDVQRAIRDNLSVVDTLTLNAFFFERYRQLTLISLIYCRVRIALMRRGKRREALKREMAMLQMPSSSDGAGTTMSLPSLRPLA